MHRSFNSVPDKRKHTNNDHHEQNAPANPLANLLCHYNSDSDTEESKKDCKLDDQVNNFFKASGVPSSCYWPRDTPVTNETLCVAGNSTHRAQAAGHGRIRQCCHECTATAAYKSTSVE